MRQLINKYLQRREQTALAYAQRLLMALMAKHFPDQLALGTFEPGNTIRMVIDQIDNVATALELKRPDKCYLIGIEREGRVVKFRLVRGDDVFTIETYGTLDSNVAEWRKWAGL